MQILRTKTVHLIVYFQQILRITLALCLVKNIHISFCFIETWIMKYHEYFMILLTIFLLVLLITHHCVFILSLNYLLILGIKKKTLCAYKTIIFYYLLLFNVIYNMQKFLIYKHSKYYYFRNINQEYNIAWKIHFLNKAQLLIEKSP